MLFDLMRYPGTHRLHQQEKKQEWVLKEWQDRQQKPLADT